MSDRMTEGPVGRRWVLKEFGTPDHLTLEDFDVPRPAAGEVVLRILATTATYTDLLVLRGCYVPKFPVPVTPGYDCCAVAHAVGEGVTSVKVGDVCLCMPQHGCFSTFLLLPERLCVAVELPAGVTPELAACVPLTGVTAYQQLHRHAKKQLENPAEARVLVHSAGGGTGAMLVELLKAHGVKHVVGTCGVHNLDDVASRGAAAVDYRRHDWDKAALEASGGQGFDLVLDAVVFEGYMDKGMALLRPGGLYLAYGFTNHARPGAFDIVAAAAVVARIAIQHFVIRWFDRKDAVLTHVANDCDARPEEYKEDCREVLKMLGDGRLKPVVGRVWVFDEADEALLEIAHGEHKGKQVVHVADR